MYASKEDAYYPPPPLQGKAPPSTTGFPVNSANQFYPTDSAASLQVQSQAPGPWSTGLCGCCDDVRNCCITCFCPCVTFGQIAEIVDRGSSSCGASGALYTLICCVTGCSCVYSCFYRSKMRRQYMLHESPCADCLVHCCCETCALCQEYRELKRHGFDMHIGWHANMERQGRVGSVPLVIPPVVQGGMSR